ncbi:MAG: vWA domain-containing protein [Tepidisphaeraceae bacterium]
MQPLLRILFGLKPAPWTDGGAWRLDWLALPKHDGRFFLAAGIIGVAILAWLLYRWEARGVGWPMRVAFVALRLVVLVGVLGMLLEPVIVFSKTEQEPSNVLVLVDRSDSMNLAEPYSDTAQAKKLADALKLEKGPAELADHPRQWLADRAIDGGLKDKLAAGGDRVVRVEAFAQQLLEASKTSTTKPTVDPALKASTAIGSSLRQAIAAYRGQPLAGVLLLTDGQSNAGEALAKAADFAAGEGVPIVSLAVGTPEGPRNATVTKIDVSPVVFIKDPNRLRVLIESRGMSHAPATLVLEKQRDGGPWEEAARQQVTLEEGGRVLEVPFDFKEDKPAKLAFRARLIDAGPELTDADNIATADVRAIRQKIRVLFIAGSTFPEVEFIRNTLLRDTGLSASTWLQTADAKYSHPGNPSIRRLPATSAELNDYDCIILYDPDPALWPGDFPKLLTDFVADAGGGLVYIAGERNTKNLFDHPEDAATSWLSLLPVVSEPGLYQSDVSVQLSSREAWKLQITPEGQADPIFQFSPKPDENETILNHLPGMFWHFPVTRARAAPRSWPATATSACATKTASTCCWRRNSSGRGGRSSSASIRPTAGGSSANNSSTASGRASPTAPAATSSSAADTRSRSPATARPTRPARR